MYINDNLYVRITGSLVDKEMPKLENLNLNGYTCT